MRFQKYLEQIFSTAKGSRICSKHKGSKGGYELAKPPEKITLSEVIRLIDGPLASVGSASLYFLNIPPSSKMKNCCRCLRTSATLWQQSLKAKHWIN